VWLKTRNHNLKVKAAKIHLREDLPMKKINRKIFSLSLALVMLIGVIIPALAIEPVEEPEVPEVLAAAVEAPVVAAVEKELITSERYGQFDYSHLSPQEAVAVANANRRPHLPRYIATTDNEIDDMSTFNRLLLYTDQIDVVGLIYSAAEWHWAGDGENVFTRDFFNSRNLRTSAQGSRPGYSFRWLGTTAMQAQVEAYRQVYDNMSNFGDFACPDYLRDLIFVGNIVVEGDMYGPTPGSDLIKYTLICDEDDSPVWLSAWGGTNTVAMGLKSIADEFGSATGDSVLDPLLPGDEGYDEWIELRERVIDKARIYIILDQDRSYPLYIATYWPEIPVINNRGQFWSFAYQHRSRTPNTFLPYLEGAMIKPHIVDIDNALLNRYMLMSDGHNITNRSWFPNTAEIVPGAPALPGGTSQANRRPNGHTEPPMGWGPRFIQGSNRPTANNIDAPWTAEEAPDHWLINREDPRWMEWGEIPGDDRGHPGANTGIPQYSFISEGDSPSFFHLLDVGLRSKEDMSWGGWGGRFENSPYNSAGTITGFAFGAPAGITTSSPTPNLYSDVVRETPGGATRNVQDAMPAGWHVGNPAANVLTALPQMRWARELQNDWFARALWGIAAEDVPEGMRHNREPVVSIIGDLDIYAAPGASVSLVGDAYDPDGDELSFYWWQYREAGKYNGNVTLNGGDTKVVDFVVPEDARDGDTIHIIFAVTDVAPVDIPLFTPLTRYQRVVVTVHTPIRIVTVEPTRTTEGAWEIRCEICDELLEYGVIPMLDVVNAVTAPKDFVSMRETFKGSRVWALTFKAFVTLADEDGEIVGTEWAEYTILLNGNNANLDGRFTFDADHELAGRTLIYDIKGNGSNIKALRFA